MGLDINSELAKASQIMSRYRMSEDDQIEVVRILVDAGVEKCLDEQQRIREQTEALISRATGGLVH